MKLKWHPFKDWLYVDIAERGEKVLASGIIIADDDMQNHGIKPRWCTVLAIGDEFPDQAVQVGDSVLLEHLGWSRGMELETDTGEFIKVWGTKEEKILLLRPKED